MSRLSPTLADFDRIVSTSVPVLDDSDIALKIAMGCGEAEITDETAVEALLAHGIRPDQVGGHWPTIIARAAEIAAAPEKLFDVAVPVALAVVGTILFVTVSPAWAFAFIDGEEPVVSREVGAWLFLALAIGSAVMALRPRRAGRSCPHAEPHGDVPQIERESRS